MKWQVKISIAIYAAPVRSERIASQSLVPKDLAPTHQFLCHPEDRYINLKFEKEKRQDFQSGSKKEDKQHWHGEQH